MGDWLKINGGKTAGPTTEQPKLIRGALTTAEAIFATKPWSNGPYGEGPTKILPGSFTPGKG